MTINNQQIKYKVRRLNYIVIPFLLDFLLQCFFDFFEFTF